MVFTETTRQRRSLKSIDQGPYRRQKYISIFSAVDNADHQTV